MEKNCSLSEEQRKNGLWCRSMFCKKCIECRNNWHQTTTSTGNETEFPMKESRHEKDIGRLRKMRR